MSYENSKSCKTYSNTSAICQIQSYGFSVADRPPVLHPPQNIFTVPGWGRDQKYFCKILTKYIWIITLSVVYLCCH